MRRDNLFGYIHIFAYLCSKLFEETKASMGYNNTDPTPNPPP